MAGPGRAREDDDMTRLLALLDDACRSVEAYRPPTHVRRRGVAAGDPANLLDQCMALCAERESQPTEPVRTLHHMACTGGTLISKALTTMPNVQLLSEVDPLSLSLLMSDETKFEPTDLIALLRQSSRGIDDQLAAEVFVAGLAVVLEDCNRRGLRLVLRDHAHSHFCLGDTIPDRPGLREMVAGVAPVLSVVTVRHPLDSYLSLLEFGWDSYAPRGLDEYCRRYLAFLDYNADLPMFRYEDFVAAPEPSLRLMCESLQLPFRTGFQDLIGVFRLTGDSGRQGETIEPRPRRPVPDEVADEIQGARHLVILLQRLGYDD